MYGKIHHHLHVLRPPTIHGIHAQAIQAMIDAEAKITARPSIPLSSQITIISSRHQ